MTLVCVNEKARRIFLITALRIEMNESCRARYIFFSRITTNFQPRVLAIFKTYLAQFSGFDWPKKITKQSTELVYRFRRRLMKLNDARLSKKSKKQCRKSSITFKLTVDALLFTLPNTKPTLNPQKISTSNLLNERVLRGFFKVKSFLWAVAAVETNHSLYNWLLSPAAN